MPYNLKRFHYIKVKPRNMLSIVIPTMQKDVEVLNKLLSELEDSPAVGEVLLIDNSCKGFEGPYSKLKVLVQKENLFVNPAWNLGVESSNPKFSHFGVLNDDIIFPKSLFAQVDDFLSNAGADTGLAGIDCVNNTPKAQFDSYPEESEVKFEPAEKLQGFWGAAYFGDKRNYVHIPEEMKVFYGDHFLFTRNVQAGRRNFKITNLRVKHLESLTSHSSSFIKSLFKKDRRACIKVNGVEHQELSLLQRIFSVTYYHEHYVLAILGLKLKFRAKKK